MRFPKTILPLLLLLSVSASHAQFGGELSNPFNGGDDDLEIGGDIFSDFNEDLDTNKVLEDERFYRYGRFFSFSLGLGTTTFTGNRGLAYDDDNPSYNFGVSYFLNFHNAITMGIAYSQHNMFIGNTTIVHASAPPGNIEVRMLRVHFGYRYYIDTDDLGTAITWSNPYLTGNFEYWYQKNKFLDLDNIDTLSGGGMGTALGGGFEFPVQIKESYIGFEVLFHRVNFFDRYTADYQVNSVNGGGYEDLTGDVWSVMLSYVFSW